jgi:DNA repair exonuclease SbcCD ATPase subunit
MAFEDLLKNGSNQTSQKPQAGLLNFASSLAVAHHDQVLKREELLQSIMISQGEYDYLVLELKAGKQDLLNDLLDKKSALLEKNIIFLGASGNTDPGDLTAVNRQSDQLTKYRMELEAIKQAKKNEGQYVQELLKEINIGVDLEGVMVDSLDNYLTVIADKLKFGGIVDQGRISRLCGFASMAAKKGNLILALKSYSTAGMIVSIKDDFKKIVKKAKKEKNPQYKEAEELLSNLLPKNNKK